MLPPDGVEKLSGYDLRGDANNLLVSVKRSAGGLTGLDFQANVRGMAVDAFKGAPKLDSVNGYVRSNGDTGTFWLDSEKARE